MTLEAPRVPEDSFGSLQSCLVEGDPQSEKRARRIKRRAVAISIALQTIALTALVLYPLLSKGERISYQYATPIPPFTLAGNHHKIAPSKPREHPRPEGHFFTPSTIPPRIVMHDPAPTRQADGAETNIIPGAPNGDSSGTLFGIEDPNHARGPERPTEVEKRTERHKISELQQMARLVTRVEPIYPPLAVDIHREGRVELHAIISTTGKIESLEVISGDPFFIQSALSAVRQWRYNPTILNGSPIEVDTHITVIYTLNH